MGFDQPTYKKEYGNKQWLDFADQQWDHPGYSTKKIQHVDFF